VRPLRTGCRRYSHEGHRERRWCSGAKGPEFGSQDSKIICLWAAIPANLTPIESAICRQRGGRVFGQPLAQAPRWLSTS